MTIVTTTGLSPLLAKVAQQPSYPAAVNPLDASRSPPRSRGLSKTAELDSYTARRRDNGREVMVLHSSCPRH